MIGGMVEPSFIHDCVTTLSAQDVNWITVRLITSVGLAGANSHLLVLDARACLARAIVSFCYNSSGPRGASLPMEGREIPRGFFRC